MNVNFYKLALDAVVSVCENCVNDEDIKNLKSEHDVKRYAWSLFNEISWYELENDGVIINSKYYEYSDLPDNWKNILDDSIREILLKELMGTWKRRFVQLPSF